MEYLESSHQSYKRMAQKEGQIGPRSPSVSYPNRATKEELGPPTLKGKLIRVFPQKFGLKELLPKEP